MPKLKAIDGECEKCHYKSISQHEDLKNPRCRKCNGKIFGKAQQGYNNHMWKGGKPKCVDCGQTIAHKAKRCDKCYQKQFWDDG